LQEFSSGIEFIPHLEPSLLENCFAKTDICVFPSLWEAFGYTCIEAMAAARGIVAGKIGGMKEMLEDINPAALVNPHNPQQIAEALLQQLNNPGERIANGLRYREKVIHYYKEQVIVEMENYYREIIRTHPYYSSTSGKQ
jgi:glycogen synthase